MAPKNENAKELRLAMNNIKPENLNNYQRELLAWTKNVDKRYAWVILLALFLMMAATLGPYRVYSLFYAKVTKDGIYTREEASWPISAIFTVENIVGPFVSIITYHISYRNSMLIGSILLVLGNALAAISESLILDTLLLGVVQGLGWAFIFMPFMEIINSYFLRYRNMALGMALCGGTLSIFAWSPIFQYTLDNYYWRYSYLGVAAVCGINLLMVPLLRPNPKPQGLDERINQANNDNQVGHNKNTFARISLKALTYQNSVRRQSTILISRDAIQRQGSIISVNPFASSAGLERKISRCINDGKQGPITKQPSVLSHLSHLSVDGQQQLETKSLGEVGKEHESNFDGSIIWEILKTPGFHLIWYNELLYFWVFSIYCLVMVDYGIDRGCTKDEAESLLNFQSIGELLGRLVLTVLVDMRFVSNKNVVIFILLMMAGLLTSVTYATGFVSMACITTAIAAIASLLYILLNGLLVDFLGERQVTLGYGMASCIGGVLMSFRPQAVGYFRDHLGSYDPLMITLSLSCVLGALLWIVEPVFTKLAGKSDTDSVNELNRESIA